MKKLLLLFAVAAITLSAQKYAVKGALVYTMHGASVKNGIILIKDGKIEKVGSTSEISIPEGYLVHEGKVVLPGLVDVHSTAGVSGAYNYAHDQEQLERSDPIQPELRALDAYNPNDRLIPYLRSYGITTINTGHSEGALVSGQCVTVKTTGTTVASALVETLPFITFSVSDDVRGNFSKPGTRSKALAMLRDEFTTASESIKKSGTEESRSLRKEMFVKILKGEAKAVFTAHTAVDILAVLRLAKEFHFTPILDGGAEAYLVADELKAAGVPVMLHASMERAGGETKNISFATAGKLAGKGVLFAIKSGYEAYVPKTRVILFEAGIAAANGLGYEQALASVTINAAKILGLENKIGSLQPGMDADIAVYDGDPFEYTTHCCKVFINGVLTDDECR